MLASIFLYFKTHLHVSLVSSISFSSSLLLRTAPILSALSAPNYGKKVLQSTDKCFLRFSLYCILFRTELFGCVCISTAQKIVFSILCIYLVLLLLICMHIIKMPFCPCSLYAAQHILNVYNLTC